MVPIGKFDVRKRSPKGTSARLFNFINEWLIKRGHCDRSESMFCTSNRNWAWAFGSVMTVFPIGDFKFTYIKAQDFNNPDKNTDWNPEYLMWAIKDKIYSLDDDSLKFKKGKNGTEIIPLERLGKNKSMKIDVPCFGGFSRLLKPFTGEQYVKSEQIIDDFFVSNKNLDVAIKNKWELWFECKSYYVVNPEIFFNDKNI